MSADHRATVSLLMIVRNEEHHLADCLAPVASLFDEIVIVDTGSNDSTREVAARFTPHVFDFPWCDDFSAARNEALRRSHGEWIFWLDADDRLDDENIERLRQLLATLGTEPQTYYMNTVCSSQFACEGVNLITHPRLFRRHPGLCWQGRVHEQLRPQPGKLGHGLFLSDVRIHHIGYQDATVRQRKLNRDVRLLRMDYAIDPDSVSTLLHLGLAYFHLGRIDEARQHLRHLLTVSRTAGDYLLQVYGVLTTIATREGDLDDALATVEQGLRMFPDSEHLLYLRAECLYELDRYDEAKAMLIRIVNSQSQQVYYGGLPGDIREKLAPRKLADVHRLQRNLAAAEAILLSVVGRFPEDTHSWHLLGRVYLDLGQREKLLAVVEQLRSCPQGDIFGSLLLAVWRLARREMDEAGREIEQLIGLAPQMPMPRVLRAQWLTLINAPIPERIQACRDVLRVLPGHLDVRRMLSSLEAAQRAQVDSPMKAAHGSVLSGAGLPDAVGLT